MAAGGEQPDAAVLRLWERGAAAGPIARALLLAGEARPDLDPQQCRALPLGRRDQAIAMLRARLFGPVAEFTSRCPHCAAEVEFTIADVVEMFDTVPAPPPGPRARAVTSEDLIAAEAAAAQGRDPRAAIIARITAADGDAAVQLDAPTLDTMLESLDAGAELRFDMTCPDCAGHWMAVLDIVDCTWRELTRAVGRIADEVAALASAYGWREADTLGMSRARRALYLERMPT
jgi:hypothetical protein